MSSPKFPDRPSPIPATPTSDVDRALERLAAAKDRWLGTSTRERIAMLQAIRHALWDVAPAWVEAAGRAKGFEPGTYLAGEEWLAAPMATARNARVLEDSLRAGPQRRLPVRRAHGREIFDVMPAGLLDRALFTGWTSEVWVQPGKPSTLARIYREGHVGPGRVSLVLAAGNIASIGPMDALYKLFVDDEVVIMKMNPVNDYAGPFVRTAFKVLVDAGFFEIVYGGAETGAYLTQHPLVDTIHITGSDVTHDAIVWGPDRATHAERKAKGEKFVDKPITSELGCVTPILVCPDAWSDADIDYQARNIVSMAQHNASFDCNSGKLVVLPAGWSRKDALVDRITHHLSAMTPRRAYYPGAQARYQALLDHYPQARPFGERTDEVVPFTLIPDVPAKPGEYALVNEPFCAVLSLTEVPGDDAPSYLANAVPFCNDQVWGTLSCMFLASGPTQRAHRDAVDAAIRDLRYGSIAVNGWAGAMYGLAEIPWGAYPGHTLEDVGSGIGMVHNGAMVDHPEKSVLRLPFRVFPTPPWFYDHANLFETGRRLTRLETHGGTGAVLSLAVAALRG